MMNKEKIRDINELLVELKIMLEQSNMQGEGQTLTSSSKILLYQGVEAIHDILAREQQFQDHCKDMEEQIFFLRSKNHDLDYTIQQLTDEIQNLQLLMEQMEERYKKDICQVNESQQSLQNTYDDLSQTLNEQKGQNYQLKRNEEIFKKKLNEFNDLFEQQNKKQRKYEQIEQENQILVKRILEMKEFFEELRDEIDALREENLKIKQQKQMLKQNLADYSYVWAHHQSKNSQFSGFGGDKKNLFPESYCEDDYEKSYYQEKILSDSPTPSLKEQSRCSIRKKLRLSRNSSLRHKYRRSTVYIMKDVQQEEELSQFNHQISLRSDKKIKKQQSVEKQPSLCDISIVETKRTSSSLKSKKKVKQLEKKLNECLSNNHEDIITQLHGKLEMKDDQIKELKNCFELEKKVGSDFRKRMYEQKLKINEEKNILSVNYSHLMEEYLKLQEKVRKMMEGVDHHMRNTMKNIIEENFSEMQEYDEMINSRKFQKMKCVSKSSVELFQNKEKIFKDRSSQCSSDAETLEAISQKNLNKQENRKFSQQKISQKSLYHDFQAFNIEIKSYRHLSAEHCCSQSTNQIQTQPSIRASLHSISSFQDGIDSYKDQEIAKLNLIFEEQCEQSVLNSAEQSFQGISNEFKSDEITIKEMELLKKYLKISHQPTKQRELQKINEKKKWQAETGKIYVCRAIVRQTGKDDKVVFWDSGIVSMRLQAGMSMNRIKKNIQDNCLFIMGNCEVIIEGKNIRTKRDGKNKKKNYFSGKLPDMTWIINSMTTYQI